MTKKFPQLNSERLTVRLPMPEDVSSIVRYFTENKEHLAKTSSSQSQDLCTEKFWQSRILKGQEEFQSGTALRFFAFKKSDQSIVGALSLTDIKSSPAYSCFLGYNVSAKEQGQGFATEYLRLLIDYAFKDLNLHRIMSNYLPSNLASAKVMKKLGFEVEGLARDYLFLNGKWEDHVLTSLLNNHWKSAP